MKKNEWHHWVCSLSLPTILLTAGCASQVTISSNIRRTLPIIIDDSFAGERKLEAGLAYRNGQEEGESNYYYYQVAVNQTFTAYDRSNSTAYVRYNPRQRFSVRLGIDDLGYSGDLAVRTKPSSLTGFAAIGVTVADRTQISGYSSTRPAYPRLTLGLSAAPLSLTNVLTQAAKDRFRVYGNVSLLRYPIWLDFTQTYQDTTSATPLVWNIKSLEDGEAKVVSTGISYEGGRFVFSAGIQKPFAVSEPAVRVDLGSEPPYLISANPSPAATWVGRIGVRF